MAAELQCLSSAVLNGSRFVVVLMPLQPYTVPKKNDSSGTALIRRL
jgi:hypothetical protein